jgi:hypothetical protein
MNRTIRPRSATAVTTCTAGRHEARNIEPLPSKSRARRAIATSGVLLVALAACGSGGSAGQSATTVATTVAASTTTVGETTSTTAAATTTTPAPTTTAAGSARDINSLAPGPRLIANKISCTPNNTSKFCQPAPVAACIAPKSYDLLSDAAKAAVDGAAATNGLLPKAGQDEMVSIYLGTAPDCISEGVVGAGATTP